MSTLCILGNPNSGKSLLFNRLTGLRHKVANYPGVTVEMHEARIDDLLVRDLPGIYSLSPLTRDERVAVSGFLECVRQNGGSLTRVICVLDATRLERSLYLLLQLMEMRAFYPIEVIAAVNIIDEIRPGEKSPDIAALSAAVGCPFVAVSAKKRTGIDELMNHVKSPAAEARRSAAVPSADPSDWVERTFARDKILELKRRAHELAEGLKQDNRSSRHRQNQVDSVLLRWPVGPVFFAAVMVAFFQSIFTLAAPLMDSVETLVSGVGDWAAGVVPAGVASDFVSQALLGGIGSFLVFTPQIFIMFLVVGFLEDSGYLARGALLLHRPLGRLGLSGRSFLPLLSGHACAIPAIMAARTIESPRRRLITMLVVPFTSCSARLPVYGLLIAAFVPSRSFLGGLVGLQGLALFLLYAIGLTASLASAWILDRTLRGRGDPSQDAPFILELPPYRWPSWIPIIRHAFSRAISFVTRAGGIIFAVTVVIWALGYFPNGAGQLEQSWLAQFGRWIEPVFQVMGLDWKVGVAILTSFLAREVFVGTLGTLYGLGAEGDVAQIGGALARSGVTLESAVALLVFYALSMQCVSTLAVLRRETGRAIYSVYVFIAMSAIAYVSSAATYALMHR